MTVLELIPQYLTYIARAYEQEPGKCQPQTFETAHALSCMRVCMILADKRRLDTTIAGTIGLIHDIGRIATGSNQEHAEKGVEPARRFLAAWGYTKQAESTIVAAVANHSRKHYRDDAFSELIKDADVFDSAYYGMIKQERAYADRLQQVRRELGLAAL